MASVPPHRAELLARSFDNANLDGNCTLEEAIAHTDGMKILYLEKPMVVNKEPGSIKLGDLPAKMEITDSVKKKTQFLDVIADHEGPIDLNAVETMFLQQRYADLPEPVHMKGNFQAPYNLKNHSRNSLEHTNLLLARNFWFFRDSTALLSISMQKVLYCP